MKISKAEKYFVYPQGVCRIRKPACADNGCAIFPALETAQLGKKIRCSAEDNLFGVSLRKKAGQPLAAVLPFVYNGRKIFQKGGFRHET